MSSTPSFAAGRGSTARRQSCDRCHSQKLRCTRPGHSTSGVCSRCLRQSAQCTYSPSLPKGRPRMFRPANTPISAPTPPTSSSDAMADDNANSPSNSSCSAGPGYHWPPPTPIMWNDMLDGPSDHSSTPIHPDPAFLHAFPNLSSCALPLRNGEVESQQHIHPALHDLDLGMPFGSDMADPNSSSSSSSSSMATSNALKIPTADKNGPELGIALLSQLSTRLYPLHRSSCQLAEAAAAAKEGNPAHTGPLIDDDALKCVASWLVHVSANMTLSLQPDSHYPPPPLHSSTTGETLHGALCGAHQLLEILQCLQSSSTPTTTTMPGSSSTGTSTTPNSTCSRAIQSAFRLQQLPPTPSNQSSNTVVRHLVIACRTLLLNIYVGVLFALQHDADLRVAASMPATGSSNNNSSSSSSSSNGADTSTLTDIRVVLVVQLYSYLLGRLHHAVASYSTPVTVTTTTTTTSAPPHSHNDHFAPDIPHPPIPPPGGAPLANSEGIRELEIEVQQRLARLRQTLRI